MALTRRELEERIAILEDVLEQAKELIDEALGVEENESEPVPEE